MKDVSLYESFLAELRKKIPQGAKLTNTLVDMLYIEREAVYRRLRGEVPFTFMEVMTIAKELGISLDNLTETDTCKSRPFQLKLVEYANPLDADFRMMQDFVEIFACAENEPDWEAGFSTNTLPQSFCCYYPGITRFYLFKWLYQYSNVDTVKPFREVVINDRLARIQQDFLHGMRCVKSSFYILDHLVFHYLVTDMLFFASINLITPEELKELQEELILLLEKLERFTAKGRHEDTGNEMYIYLSNINLDTGYCYFGSPNYRLSMLKAFTLNVISSFDLEMFNWLKSWMNSLKRSSTLITVSGEKERVRFFNDQYRLVLGMTNTV